MDTRKIALSAATTSLLTISLATAPARAQTINHNDISNSLVKDTIKPRLMEQAFQTKQNQISKEKKLQEVKAEQKRMDAMEKAKLAARKKANAKIAQAKRELKNRLASSQAPRIRKLSNNTQPATTVNKGQFKLSFYDPAAMGSNMGYGGVAANLSVFPRGTKLKITLSDGTVWHRVVNDTGSFAQNNPRQLDVAMPNSQVPSAGILYATVEVEQ
ncbi:3D (Asp-Asp-Asp) domain-containing protein [Lactobacillus colini]|uniref:3D (Asp-Asp-Asp) domain-containing protein n=1 Tax=Lactobacillus colini TaxID=1819254 RepID=A0ABS4MEM1_9LACO|nr:hydrolase [Lactobacillus colini]MBP2058131.1 3D (Asp-Asp-Asp) domain-containing protein [Lactobacillus colini]